jgi:hypothetical protein
VRRGETRKGITRHASENPRPEATQGFTNYLLYMGTTKLLAKHYGKPDIAAIDNKFIDVSK